MLDLFGETIELPAKRGKASSSLGTNRPIEQRPALATRESAPEPADGLAGNDEIPVELTLRQTVEQYLKDLSLPYYNFDDVRKGFFSANRLQAFDFAVNAPEQTYLVFADEPEIANRNDLRDWERIFGPGFTALVTEKVPVDIGDEFTLAFRTLDGEKVALL